MKDFKTQIEKVLLMEIRKASAQFEPVTKICYEAECFRVTTYVKAQVRKFKKIRSSLQCWES
jgi:hypothetical protein